VNDVILFNLLFIIISSYQSFLYQSTKEVRLLSDKLGQDIDANTALIISFIPVLQVLAVPDTNLAVQRKIEWLGKISEHYLIRVGITDKRMPVPETSIPETEKNDDDDLMMMMLSVDDDVVHDG